MAKVHLDFGHGGIDSGAVGNGLLEKDLTLVIGKKVQKIIVDEGVTVTTSRDDDRYLKLTPRADISNKNKADVFISIHVNSFHGPKANGVETYSHVGSKQGSIYAKMVHEELVSAKLFKTDRGTKTANFTVLAKTKAPAILVELGFISNKEDSIVLVKRQDDIALALAKGLLRTIGILYRENKEVSKPVSPNLNLEQENKLLRGRLKQINELTK